MVPTEHTKDGGYEQAWTNGGAVSFAVRLFFQQSIESVALGHLLEFGGKLA